KKHPNLPLRMGVHSGPVSGVVDVNEQTSVAGAGINMAHRVMDCGDAGHILLSKHVAEDLEQYAQWKPYLHDLGECEVKHGVHLHLVNLYTGELGNPALPEKFKPTAAPKILNKKWALIGSMISIAGLIALGFLIFGPVGMPLRGVRQISAAEQGHPGAPAPIPEQSIAVLP